MNKINESREGEEELTSEDQEWTIITTEELEEAIARKKLGKDGIILKVKNLWEYQVKKHC